MKKAVLLVLVLASLVGAHMTTQADDTPKKGSQVTARADDASTKAAKTLSGLVVTKQTYNKMIVQLSATLSQGIAASGGGMNPDLDKKVQGAIREAIPYNELVDLNASLYSKHFTGSELKQLIGFYKTPVGEKLSAKLPEITAEAGASISKLLPDRLPQALKKQGLEL